MYLNKKGLFFFIFITQLLLRMPLAANIYYYIDEDGVSHFTNIKTERRYQLYYKFTSKPPVDYIKSYQKIINQAAKRYDMEPALIKAVIKAESNFDNHALSNKGAKGLMQLMPDTAYDMNLKDPFDPKENIFAGTRYLSLLLKRFNNDTILALAAYNAGPENVAAYEGVPPFRETKDFIVRVINYYKKDNNSPD